MWSAAMNQKKMIELIFYHLKRYPAMELEDIYKLLYQSVMGPAHILQNKELAYSYLKKDLNHIMKAMKLDCMLIFHWIMNSYD